MRQIFIFSLMPLFNHSQGYLNVDFIFETFSNNHFIRSAAQENILLTKYFFVQQQLFFVGMEYFFVQY